MFLVFRIITVFRFDYVGTDVVYLGCGTKEECEKLASQDSTYWRKCDYAGQPRPSVFDDDVYLAYTTKMQDEDCDTFYPNVIYLIVDSTKSMTKIVRDWM